MLPSGVRRSWLTNAALSGVHPGSRRAGAESQKRSPQLTSLQDKPVPSQPQPKAKDNANARKEG